MDIFHIYFLSKLNRFCHAVDHLLDVTVYGAEIAKKITRRPRYMGVMRSNGCGVDGNIVESNFICCF